MDKTDTQSFQHFKFTLPILKTRIAIVKDVDGKDIEKKYVEGVASSTDLDLHGDRMDPSAIKTMADSLKFHVIRLNAEHDTSWQSELGDISKLDVSDDSRLLIEAELNDMSKSKDLWYAITELNKKLGLSIGGYVKEYEMVKEEFKNEESGEMETKWVRHYKNIELDHIAVTSSPANPKTWVGAIAKSIQEDSELLVEKLEEAETKETIKETVALKSQEENMETKKEKKLRDIARNIVRAIQNLEADLLLELTYAGLNILSESQVKLLDTLLIERNKAMNKDVSLEAEEAKKADTAAKPVGETVETPAAPENESKEEVTPKEEPKEGEEIETPAEPAAPLAEDKPAEEKPVESEPTEEPKEESKTEDEEAQKAAAPKDGDACTLPDGSKGTIKGGKCVAETTKSEESSGEEGKDEKEGEKEVEPTSPEGKPEDKPTIGVETEPKKPEEKPADEAEVKSTTEATELSKSIQTLTDGMKEILKTNETLAQRVAELEKEPASRKTVELEKGVGDDDSEPVNAKSLKEEMDSKIAQVRKDNYGNPNLFAMTQKIRAEYAKKIRG